MAYKNPNDPRARASRRKYYYKNKKKQIAKKQERRVFVQKLIAEKKSAPCFDCKISYPSFVMDFDHLRDKKFNISSAPIKGYSLKKILIEIEKCDVVCSNCHRLRTHRDDS